MRDIRVDDDGIPGIRLDTKAKPKRRYSVAVLCTSSLISFIESHHLLFDHLDWKNVLIARRFDRDKCAITKFKKTKDILHTYYACICIISCILLYIIIDIYIKYLYIVGKIVKVLLARK